VFRSECNQLPLDAGGIKCKQKERVHKNPPVGKKPINGFIIKDEKNLSTKCEEMEKWNIQRATW
jgi:hypothetical protein